MAQLSLIGRPNSRSISPMGKEISVTKQALDLEWYQLAKKIQIGDEGSACFGDLLRWRYAAVWVFFLPSRIWW